ncbi:MAG: hypothetical protein ABSB75_02220 [Candidatus Limnocylindrales bacterium]
MTPRPYPAIVKPGALDPDAELQALTKASFARTLTKAEQAQSDALSFRADAQMETARLIRTRHPDLYPQLPAPLRNRLEGVNTPTHREESYEALRLAAIAAGRAVPEPDAAAIDEVDRMAAEVRATASDPYADLDDRHRAAFGAALRAEGLGPVAVKEWAGWLAERVVANEYATRRARALTWMGRTTYADRRPVPTLITELEALGGGTGAAMMPIPQR